MIDSIIHKIQNNTELAKIIVMPGLVFFLDLVIRSAFGMELVDAGADMALLGTSTFLTLIMEVNQQKIIVAATLFLIFFLAIWIVCLRIVSFENLLLLSPFSLLDFRSFATLVIGITAFMLSTVFAHRLMRIKQA